MEKLTLKEVIKAVGGKLVAGDENLSIDYISTNSKDIKANTLFIPIVGERIDAHDFINNAFELGAVATFTSRKLYDNKNNHMDIKEGAAYIEVDNTLAALQALARYYRSKFDIPVIGITGSVGKTTTKEMIASALETKYKVLKTAGNMNSQVGLPLTLFGIDKSHQVAVIEMGMSEFGEMKILANIAKPTIAVITNIGVSHIGQLKTRSNILKEKLSIITEFNKENRLYMNGNDSLLAELAINKDDINAKALYFGTTELCDHKASNIQTMIGKTYFTFSSVLGSDTVSEDIELGVLGVHNVYNALVALVIAKELGIEPSLSKVGLRQYRPIAMRGQIEEVGGVKLIDDTYNASPDSIKGAIEVLLNLEHTGRKIAVLADVLELGGLSYDCHYDIGVFIATTQIDEVVVVGEESRAIIKAITDSKASIITSAFTNNENAIAYIKTKIKENDAVLVKGSRGMHTDEIIEALKRR